MPTYHFPYKPDSFHTIKKKIPLLLIWIRLLIGAVIVLFSVTHPPHFRTWCAILLITGLLTDVFDGIIARRLNISTIALRRLDSSIDQVFWLSILLATFIINPHFYTQHLRKMIQLLSIEGLTYAISFVRFRKEVATHTISSKVWTLLITVVLLQLILTNEASWFNLCFVIGVITRLEIIAILLSLRKWTNDVPSIYHAILLRKGKHIRRNKLFNG